MIIELPSPFSRMQIKAVASILAEELPSYVQPGIQLLQMDRRRKSRADFKELTDLVKSTVPEEFYLEVHAPICPHDPLPELNLVNADSAEIILANAFFAWEVGAETLIIHTNTVYYSASAPGRNPVTVWDESNNKFEVMRRNIKERMYENLFLLAEKSPVVIGVENMPLPINGDRSASATGIIYEPNMVTYEDLLDFCRRTQDCPKLGVVYDTSHGVLANGILNELREQGIDTSAKLMCTPFRGIYPEFTGIQPEVDVAVKGLCEQSKLVSVQLAEAGERWKIGQVLQEDAPLGGKDYPVLLDLVKSLRETEVPFSLDIGEKDYLSRPNQRASLKRLLADLPGQV